MQIYYICTSQQYEEETAHSARLFYKKINSNMILKKFVNLDNFMDLINVNLDHQFSQNTFLFETQIARKKKREGK